jgi:hypothetical protein
MPCASHLPDASQLAWPDRYPDRLALPNDTLKQKETMSALSQESGHGLRESFALAKACVIELCLFYSFVRPGTIKCSLQNQFLGFIKI